MRTREKEKQKGMRMKRYNGKLNEANDFSKESDLKERLSFWLDRTGRGANELSMDELEGVSAGAGGDSAEINYCYKRNVQCEDCIFGRTGQCQLGLKKGK